MNIPKITNHQLIQAASGFWQWRWVWISSTAVFGVLGLLYVAFLKGDMWCASQGLIVRDEANGAVMRLGRFESQTAMKAAQETVLEMARNTQVLTDALLEVGTGTTPFTRPSKPQPSLDSQVVELAKMISIRAPQGAELGTTEVIYLDVKQTSRERALALVAAVCDALETRLKQVRQARAGAVISELLAAKEAAALYLEKATNKMQVIEADIGTDLSDLRGLTDSISSTTSIRQSLEDVIEELRAAELELQQIAVDLSTAKESLDDPQKLLFTPTKLVNSQPGLRRLCEGLAAAAINTSQLQGRYTKAHPLVIASRETEGQIREELRAELKNSVATLTRDHSMARERVSKLMQQRDLFERRIAKLAAVRAEYGNIASEVRARNIQLQEAERELASAEAAYEAAQTSSLITRIDAPTIGERPIGPGRTTLLAGATLGGLFFGLGLIFLLNPMDANINYGRRKLDVSGQAGRRASDRVSAIETSPPQVHAGSQTPLPQQKLSAVTQSIQPAHEVGRASTNLDVCDHSSIQRSLNCSDSSETAPSAVCPPNFRLGDTRAADGENRCDLEKAEDSEVYLTDATAEATADQGNQDAEETDTDPQIGNESNSESRDTARHFVAPALATAFSDQASAIPQPK